MKSTIYWIVAFISFIMTIVFWGFGLSFDDTEVRGIFTLISLTMLISETVLIGKHCIKQY